LDIIKAVVQKVIQEGKHGPFAVATSNQIEGSVTFSLEPTVWKEKEWPERGMVVRLGELRQKRAGWRAKTGRFWTPSDEQTQQAERSKQMIQFLYPRSRQFPFDGVCEQIIRELEQRNWQVPGIDVEFREYGTGDEKYRAVLLIRGHDFKLRFDRPQGTLPGGRWDNCAGVSDLVIPKREINVYDDESGPTFYLYVGKDWEHDRERFMDGAKVNSKLHGDPRIYLIYRGGCDCQQSAGASFEAVSFLIAAITHDAKKLSNLKHTHSGRRSPLLVHDNDLGREYDPERGNWNWLDWKRDPGDPAFFFTGAVMEEFKKYLEEVVLAMIVSHPIPKEKIDRFVAPKALLIPEIVGQIFCFADYRDAERIKQGKLDVVELNPSDRYGLQGSGYRLMSLDAANDGTVPEIAYDGFLWCGIGEVTETTEIKSLHVPGHYRWSDNERFVIRIKPNRANGIYIADHAPYEKRRQEVADSLGDRKQFTNEELGDFARARARTIIPIHEYKGGYEQPVVLVNRELSLDEVEVVSGPHEYR